MVSLTFHSFSVSEKQELICELLKKDIALSSLTEKNNYFYEHYSVQADRAFFSNEKSNYITYQNLNKY